MVNHTKKSLKSFKKAMFDCLLKPEPLRCIKCEWIWTPRKDEPKCCPGCKSYGWKTLDEKCELNCCRCDFYWTPRKNNPNPKACPKCKSYYWNVK